MRLMVVVIAAATCLASCAPVWPSRTTTTSAETELIAGHVASLRQSLTEPAEEPLPQVLLLGTFHFANPAADAHRSKHTFNVFSESGQAQLDEVLDRLEKYRPTKILVERESRYQGQLDEWYTSYLAGKQANISNEIVTLGFSLAQRLGHQRVYAFDARAEWLTSTPETQEKFAAAAKDLGKEWALQDPVNARYSAMYKQSDDIEETLTLRQRFRLMNHPDMLRMSHGAYFFFSGFRVNADDQFPGPDGFASAWHNRNLRMFSIIQRHAERGDRLLVLVGAGHVPILQHCVQTCPTMRWIAVDDYLAQ
ncbi:MAG TPA: DUF5694 domain-containing protein [Phycisphaerales bacterium]|nr:DUF5694 domain-containing protein [Phycisphaerales bacterium]